MPFRRFQLLVWLTFSAVVLAQSASPSNTTSYRVPSQGDTLLLAMLDGQIYYPIIPLTSVAFSQLPNGKNADEGINGYLYVTNNSADASLNYEYITLIDCDTSSNAGFLSVIQTAIAVNVQAILFYSTTYDYCKISGNYGSFTSIYSMTSRMDSLGVLSLLRGTNGEHEYQDVGIILPEVAFNNVFNSTDGVTGGGGNTGTAVAMIILYAITGLITAMFLTIIITGAVRAHRHPERYGPNRVFGRTRQSRARGLARAMLDTIPIVKFGDKEPAKAGDVELVQTEGGVPATSDNLRASSEPARAGATDPAQDPEKAPSNEPRLSNQYITTDGAATSTASSSNPLHNTVPLATSQEPISDPNALVCSICTDDFARGEDIRLLPCSHKFHPACVDPWLLDVSGTCPLCRVDLRPAQHSRSSSFSGPSGAADSPDPSDPAALPPPLDPASGRRRDILRALLSFRTNEELQNPVERMEALRQFRRARAAGAVGSAGNAGRGNEALAAELGEGGDERRRRSLLRGLMVRRRGTMTTGTSTGTR